MVPTVDIAGDTLRFAFCSCLKAKLTKHHGKQ